MTTLAIDLLGPPQIALDGVPLAVDTRKAIAILARVAVEGVQRRDRLADLLWPESDSARARGALRRTLSVLRAALEDVAFEVDREQVRLEGHESDIAEFRAQVDAVRDHHGSSDPPCSACVERLRNAVALHRGEFMAGFGLRDSPGFDDWQYLRADELRGELATTQDLLVNALVHRGELQEATALAHRRLAIDPLHEPTHRRIMLLHAWTDRRQDAIRQYRECVAVLDRELGVPPLEATTDLYQAILAGRHPHPPVGSGARETADAAAVRPSGTSHQPRAQLPLVGRDEHLRELDRAYEAAADRGQLVVVEGEAGVGKTRLVEELADRVRGAGAVALTVRCYPGEETLAYGSIADALRAVSLGQRRPRVAAAWLSEVARLVPELLGRDDQLPPPAPLETREADRRFFEGVRQTLFSCGSEDRAGLIVIEDLHWADAASRRLVTYLAHRLGSSPVCLVLTWRTEQLGRGQELRRLAGDPRDRSEVTHLIPQRLSADEVAQLLGHLELSGDELAERLFRETEGLPLFLAEYLDALRAEHAEGSRWEVPAGVRDLLEQRLAALSEAARQILTTAAVLGRSFDLRTLLHVSGRSEQEVVEAVDELLESDVVMEIPAEGALQDTRYDFRHHALRAVAYERSSIARRRLLHGRAARTLQRPGRAADVPAQPAVVAEHLRLAGEEEQAAEAFAAAGDQSRALAAHADAVAHYRAALALGHDDQARLHEAIGDLLTLLGDYAAALVSYEAAAGASHGEATVRFEQRIAGIHERRGDWPSARAHLEAALSTLPAGDSPAMRARLEGALSLTAHRTGAHDEARRRARASLQLAEAAGDPLAETQANNLLGMISRSAGELDLAAEHLRRSLELAEAVGDPAATVAATNNLALVHADLGELPVAMELGKTALARCRSYGDRHREAAILNTLADLLNALGQREEAMAHLKEAVTIFADIGEPEANEPEIWKLVDW